MVSQLGTYESSIQASYEGFIQHSSWSVICSQNLHQQSV